MNHLYRAFGLTVSLPFSCPSLPHARSGHADVTVVEGPVPRALTRPLAADSRWQAEIGKYLWKGGNSVGRFLVERGHPIRLQRAAEARDHLLAFYFLRVVMAAALRQSGRLVLHASSLLTPRGAVAIAGESGCGKSTTLAVLLQRGCKLLSDDVTVLKSHGREVSALPGVAQYALRADSAQYLGHDLANSTLRRTPRQKLIVPAEQLMAEEQAPLRAIYVLHRHSEPRLKISQLAGAGKFSLLQRCIYGPMLPGEHPDHFPLFAALSQQVDVFRVDRPTGVWTCDAIADLVLHG